MSGISRAETLDSSFSIDSYLGGEAQNLTPGSLFNPGNQLYQFSNGLGFLSLRVNADVGLFQKTLRFVLRPRLHGILQVQPVVTPPPPKAPATSLGDVFLNEAFFEVKPSDSFDLAIGRQNFQWGPAESLNLSNLMRPELLIGIQPFYEVRGRYMARANVSIGGNFSWITLAELNPIVDQHFESTPQTSEISQSRLETKFEYSWANGSNNIGLVAGQRKMLNSPSQTIPSAGLYASFTLSDAWQIYAEGRTDHGTDYVYPRDGGFSDPTTDQNWYLISLAGVRYTASEGTEFRLEAIQNTLGFSDSENKQIRTGLLSPTTRDAYLAVAGQTTIPGQNLLYLSIRSSSQKVLWGIFRQPVSSFHSLFSVQDGSSFSFVSFESGLSDRFSIYLYAGTALGDQNSEFRRLLDQTGGLALRLSL